MANQSKMNGDFPIKYELSGYGDTNCRHLNEAESIDVEQQTIHRFLLITLFLNITKEFIHFLLATVFYDVNVIFQSDNTLSLITRVVRE